MLELNKLYNMDCMQGMKEFPDGFFDLAIVDPPYGIGIDGQKKRILRGAPFWGCGALQLQWSLRLYSLRRG